VALITINVVLFYYFFLIFSSSDAKSGVLLHQIKSANCS